MESENADTNVPISSQALPDNKETSDDTGIPIELQIDAKSRKIQKKREKYQKINDEVRLQLLDAVNKKGELLKTVNNIKLVRSLNINTRLPRGLM